MSRPAYALPKKQKAALDYIRVHILAHDESPTLEEIADAITSTKPNVRRLLDALEEHGFIKRDAFKHRSIILCEEKTDEEKQA